MYMGNRSDLDRLLYEYSKRHGGYLVGDPESGYYPHCCLLLDLGKVPILLGPQITSSGKSSYFMRCAARMQVELSYPFHMEIRPMNVLRKGIDLVARQDIKIGDQELDEKYLITGDHPDFIKMILSGSTASALFKNTKWFRVKVGPIGEEKNLHTIELTLRKDARGDNIIGEVQTLEDIERLVELSREMYEAVSRYPLPEKLEDRL